MKLKNMPFEESRVYLAIETSGAMCGVCAYVSDEKYYENIIVQKNIHSEKLYELIDITLKQMNIKLNDIYAIAISNGPGSFTGLRIGMSAVKGLAFGASLPVIPVPTFDALALQISSYIKGNDEFAIINKVSIDELYYARYKKTTNYFENTIPLEIKLKNELDIRTENCLLYGNVIENNLLNISNPTPLFVAKWAKLFGEDKKTFNFDYSEPEYFKKFIVKGKKND
ncbi:MAG: tRNA (adenosine(37)-N6)-threonylcarbamoyltransferase complex dimerization subunit type 1 TsaB [Syntrophothermus sp.]